MYVCTPNMGCVKFLYKCEICKLNPPDAPLSTTESFSAVTRACSNSRTTPDTECVKILYKCEITETLTKTREFQTQLLHYFSKSDNKSNHHHQTHLWVPLCFSAVTRARIKSHNTPNTECVKILHLALAALQCTPFFQRVPSLANCADIPSAPQGPAEEAF